MFTIGDKSDTMNNNMVFRKQEALAFCRRKVFSMKKNSERTRKEDMYKAVLQLETIEECMDFFEDICAETELRAIEQRFDVAKMLYQEKVYSDIMSATSASTATISRVNRMLNGGTGMLEKSFRRLEESEEKPESEKNDN